jgi:hypothetical protein
VAVELVTQHLYVRAPSLRLLRPGLPAPLVELVADMLLKTPVDRPTAEEVRERLVDLEAGRAARARGAPRTRASRQLEAAALPEEPPPVAGRVAVVGAALPDALLAALGAVGLGVGEGDVDVTLAAEASAGDVRRLAAAGPVVAGARRGDLARAVELLRAGAADVVELPLAGDDLTHKLRRAIATARRRRGEP